MTPTFRFDLAPEDALKFFRAKGYAISFAWQDMWQQEHEAAFTVAKMMDVDLLKDTRAAVDKAIAEGQTFVQFSKELKPKLVEAGWWGQKELVDPQTGETKLVQLGSVRRLRTIFRVNMQTAYAAGHWTQIQDNIQEAPYLMYDAVDDNRTRPEHKAWDGTVLRADDSWWDTHTPPNGFNCFPAGTLVEGEFEIGLRAWYEGPMIEIHTALGHRLTATANHPVMTMKGWSAAEQIAEGQQLLSYRMPNFAARADDVFAYFAQYGVRRARATVSDFDGDGRHMSHHLDVAYESPACLSHAPGAAQPRRLAFVADQALRPDDDLHGGGRDAEGARDDDRTEAVAIHGDDARAQRGVLVALARRFPRAFELAANLLRRFFDARPLHSLRVGPAAQWNVTLTQEARQGGTTHARFVRELLKAAAGEIAIDQVVRVRKFDFRGHVYDFQTKSGLIVAGGILVSNCRCSVIQLSERDLERLGKKPVTQPKYVNDSHEYVNPRTGEVSQVPRGIDPGWAYNPGKARLEEVGRNFGAKIAGVDPDLGAAAMISAGAALSQIAEGYRGWFDDLAQGKRARGDLYPLGALTPRTVEFLRGRGEELVSAGITIGDKEALHMGRDAKLHAGKALPLSVLRNLPRRLAAPRAVLWDKRDPALLYVLDVPDENRLGKVVVRVDYAIKQRQADGKKETVKVNSVRTGGLVELRNLADTGRYEVIEGKL